MGASMAQKLAILSTAVFLLHLPSFLPRTAASFPYPAFFYPGRLSGEYGNRRLPYYPTPPFPNKLVGQYDPRTPPIRAQASPPSPSTIA